MKNGKFHGEGIFSFSNGKFVEKGTFIFANADKCPEKFTDGDLKAQSVCQYANGDKYEAEFSNIIRNLYGGETRKIIFLSKLLTACFWNLSKLQISIAAV